MKEFFAKLGEFFQGPDGIASSKRLMGFVCFGLAVWATLTSKDFAFTSLWAGIGATLLGLGAITKS